MDSATKLSEAGVLPRGLCEQLAARFTPDRIDAVLAHVKTRKATANAPGLIRYILENNCKIPEPPRPKVSPPRAPAVILTRAQNDELARLRREAIDRQAAEGLAAWKRMKGVSA